MEEALGEFHLNQIYNTDCIIGMQKLPDGCIDLTVTSPPYDDLRNYDSYTFDFEGVANQLFRVMKQGGVVVWVVGDRIKNGNRSLTSFKQALYFQEIGFNVHDVMIYKKKNTPFMRSNAYTNCYEFMFVFSKGKPKTFNPLKTQTVRSGEEKLVANKKADGINNKVIGKLNEYKTLTNIWEYAVGLGGTTNDKIAFEHTAVFPEKLAQDHILSWSDIGDIVLDPMCGSGTTCKMAKLNQRDFLGFEISPAYTKLAKKRIELLESLLV
jgi:site-specific DNA-methyltransferase (adenine-specific)